jgi:integrase
MRGDGIVRRQSRQGMRYQVRVPDGTDGKETLGTFDTLKEAKDAKAKWQLGRRQPKGMETADAFARRWPESYALIKRGKHKGERKRESTNEHNRQAMKPFLHAFKGVPLGQIDRAAARAFAAKYPRAAVVARAIMADAYHDELIPLNPFAEVLIAREAKPEIRVPTDDEVARLEAACVVHGSHYGPLFRAQITFSRYTGIRKGEMFALKWDAIDWAEGEVTVRESISRQGVPTLPKNGSKRIVPMPDVAKEALSVLPRFGEFVFTNKHHQRLNAVAHQYLWTRVRDTAGLPQVRWHDLRHWCATALLERGRPVHQVAYQLGHEDKGETVTYRYLHPDKQRMRDEIKKAWADTVVELDGTNRRDSEAGSA